MRSRNSCRWRQHPRRGSANEGDYCAVTLATISNRLLTEADALNKRAQIDCTPAGKP